MKHYDIGEFLFMADSTDFVEEALRNTDDFWLCYFLMRSASNRLVEMRGNDPKDLSRLRQAIMCIHKICMLCAEDRRKGLIA